MENEAIRGDKTRNATCAEVDLEALSLAHWRD